MGPLSTQHLLLLDAEKPDGSVEAASHERVSVVWGEADLARDITVIEDLHWGVVLALETPQDDLVIEATRKDHVFVFRAASSVSPAEIHDVLGMLTELPGWHFFEQREVRRQVIDAVI